MKQINHLVITLYFLVTLNITINLCAEISLGKDEVISNSTDATGSIETTLNPLDKTSLPVDNTSQSIDKSIAHKKNEHLSHFSLDTSGEFCTCDLRPFVCDINCCCDSKCSEAERKLFSSCISVTDPFHEDSPKSCYSKNLFAYSSLLTGVTEKQSSSVASTLFCVEYSNVKKKTFYPNRKVLTSANDIAKIEKRDKYTWMTSETVHSHDLSDESHLHLKEGSAMRLIRPGSRHSQIWTLPSSIFSPTATGLCDSRQPVRYLRWSSTSCLRYIQSLQVDCSTFLNQSSLIDFMIDRKLAAFTSHPLTSSFSQTESIDKAIKSTSITRNEIETGIATENKANVHSAPVSSSSCLTDATCVPLTVVSNVSPTVFIKDTSSTGRSKATCVDAVRKVTYEIHFTANTDRSQASIDKINVILDTINITGARGYFRQMFDVNFIQIIPSNDSSWSREIEKLHVEKASFRLSGNPGYQMGEAILATKINPRNDNDKNESLVSNENLTREVDYKQLLVPLLSNNLNNLCPPSTSSLIHDKYITARFGENVMTSCFFNVSKAYQSESQTKKSSFFSFTSKMQQKVFDDDESGICEKMQSLLLESIDLNGKILNVTHVGIFGNSNLSHVSDWLPIINVYQGARSSSAASLTTLSSLSSTTDSKNLIDIPPLNPSGMCPSLITGISYEIYHSKIGPVDQPQVKLISIVRTFTTSHNLGPFTSNVESSLSSIRVTGTITFHDLTQGFRSKFAPPPVLTIQLPADFFYPFLLAHSSSYPLNSPSTHLVVLAIILFSLLHHNL